jgi:hypothetical protein
MIVLKTLARRYTCDPHKLRRLLRKQFGYAKTKRWKWENENNAELKKITAYLDDFFKRTVDEP